jgi:hypothetical protein
MGSKPESIHQGGLGKAHQRISVLLRSCNMSHYAVTVRLPLIKDDVEFSVSPRHLDCTLHGLYLQRWAITILWRRFCDPCALKMQFSDRASDGDDGGVEPLSL